MIENYEVEDASRTDILIWWTAQDECEAMGDTLDDRFPAYIRAEYRSRYGRNGRGRLWSDAQFGNVGIPWDTAKPASRLADVRGGIVINASDAHHVFDLPGFLTDLKLNFINALEQEPTND